ncbi:MAG: DNA-directed RNA polymerase subunit D [Candidatus Pacearchaeota archaeon]|nr:DNA-directed RNA polymerase subunit D [Candidatus Pacearchaeota archaeon]
MEIIEQKENKLIFSKEINETLANAIRRYINQIDVLAIDELDISKNDAPLYDETLAHRIGLVPIKMPKKVGAKDEFKISLKTNKEGMVYSGELKGDVEIVYDKAPLTFLNKNQELEISGIVKIGKGSDHVKFSPGILFYRNRVDIKIDKDCPKEIIETCPKNIFKIEGNKIVCQNKDKCDMCNMCVDYCDKLDKKCVEIKPSEELILTLESFGQMSTKDVLGNTINALKKDLDEVSKKIK